MTFNELENELKICKKKDGANPVFFIVFLSNTPTESQPNGSGSTTNAKRLENCPFLGLFLLP